MLLMLTDPGALPATCTKPEAGLGSVTMPLVLEAAAIWLICNCPVLPWAPAATIRLAFIVAGLVALHPCAGLEPLQARSDQSKVLTLVESGVMVPLAFMLYSLTILNSPVLLLPTLPPARHTLMVKVFSPTSTLVGRFASVARVALVSSVMSASATTGKASISANVIKRSVTLLLSQVRISSCLPSQFPYTSRSLSPFLSLSSLQLGIDFHTSVACFPF